MRKGGIHVMHRVKHPQKLDFMSGTTDIDLWLQFVRYNLRNEHYVIRLDNPDNIREIEYEDLIFNIIKQDMSFC